MNAKYGLLKVFAIAGTMLSVYRAFTDSLLLEDLLIVLFVALLLVAVAGEADKSREKAAGLHEGIGQVIGETVKEQIAGV